MKFTAALLLAPLAAAAPTIINPAHNGTAPDPSTYENVNISGLSLRESINATTTKVLGIERVDFYINGNVSCSAVAPGTQGKVFGCDGTPYSFGLVNGTTSQFGLRLYKQTSPFAGWTGSGDVATYCRSGGGAVEICEQVTPSTIVIS
ncbi:hypothetical protein N0V82_006170 [Gnomoniopsis sp. IMI 355080]|nr:hypothetical protein N0V82_006170 [Gnomoniopsis sp. IMI 355080]